MADQQQGNNSSKKKEAAELNSVLQQQLAIINQLRDSISQMSESLAKFCETSKNCFSDSNWEKATKDAAEFTKQTKTTTQVTADLSKKVSGLTGIMSKLAPAVGGVVGAFKGLKQGFTNVFAIGKGITNLFGSLIKTAFKLGSAILTIPFKVLGGLVDMANEGGGGANEFAQAMEELRKEFGFLGPTSDAVKDVAKNMEGFSDTGLSAVRVFGLAGERIKYLTELAKGMGPQFAANAKEFKENGGALLAYQKGLGLTAEQMANVAIKGKSMGKDMSTVLNSMTKQALHMSKAFGLDAKVISKDMGKAMQDVSHFGHLSTKELGAAVVYANKLGVSIDKLTGLMDQFDTFDKAAESTSKLNEQFGTNIDAMELMAAQSPAEKMEMLRKSFQATGKDMSQLSFQERKLIQQQTGLDQATFDAAMAAGDQGDMLENIKDESKRAEDATLKQADAMKQLAIQIERIVQGGGGASGGFLDRLFQGFAGGIKATKEFQGVMWNIRGSLNVVGRLGAQLGQVFVKAFPGVKQMLGGIADLFSPARFKKLSADVMGVVKKFFDPSTGEFKGKFEDLLTELKEKFFNFFDASKPAAGKIVEGFKKFAEMLGKIFVGLVNFIIPKLAEALHKFADWLRKPKIPKIGAQKEWFSPFLEAFDTIKKQLGPALKDVGLAIWQKLKEGLLGTKVGKGIIAGAIAMVLGPAIIQGLAGAGAGGALKKGISAMLGKKDEGPGAAAAAGAGAIAGAQGADISSSPSAMMDKAIPDEKTLAKMKSASESKLNWGSLMKFLLGLAGVFTIGMVAFSKAIDMVKGIAAEDIAKAAIVFGAVSLMLYPAGAFIEKLSGLGEIDGKSLIKALLALGAVMLEGIAAFGLGVLAVKKLNMSFKDLALTTLLFMAMVPAFVAAGIVVVEAALLGEILQGAAGPALMGMGAMGLVILAMIAAAAAMGGITKAIGANEMKAGAEALNLMANVFMKAGVVIGEAALIGAGIIASAGIGGIAIAAGMGAMSAAVAVMATAAFGIAESLSKLKEDPEVLKKKAEVFTLIMDSIANMMDKIKGIIDSMDFGFFESGESINERISLTKDFIKTLINGDDNKGGIAGIVQSLIDGMKEMKPDRVEATKAFAEVLNAVGGVIGSVAQAIQAVGASDAVNYFSGSAASGAGIQSAMEGAATLLDSLIPSVESLVKTLMKGLKSIPRDEGFAKGAQAFGSVLGAIGNMMKAIAPNVKDFTETVKVEGGWFTAAYTETRVNSKAIEAAAGYMTKMLQTMRDHIPPFINELMKGIGGQLKSMDQKQLDALPSVAKILEAMVQLVSALSSVGKGGDIKIENMKAVGKAEVIIRTQTPDITGMLSQLKEHMPAFVTAMLDVAKVMPTGQNFKAQIDSIVSLFGALKGMLEAIKSAGDMPKVDGKSAMESLKDAMWNVIEFLYILVPRGGERSWWNGNMIDLENIIFYFNAMNEKMSQLKSADAPKKIADLLTNLGAIVQATAKPGNMEVPEGEQTRFGLLKNSLSMLSELLGLLASDGAGSLKDISGKLDTASSSLGTGMETKAKSISDGLSKLGGVVTSITSLKLSSMTSDPDFVYAKDVGFRDVSSALEKMAKDIPEINKKIESLMENSTGVFDTFKPGDGTFAADIKRKLKMVQEVVKAIQLLDDSLAKLPTIDLQARLKKVSEMAGVGAGGFYTVKSKDVVININLSVVMESGESKKIVMSALATTKTALKWALDNLHQSEEATKNTSYTNKVAEFKNKLDAEDKEVAK